MTRRRRTDYFGDVTRRRRTDYFGDVVIFDPPDGDAKAFLERLKRGELAQFEPDPARSTMPEQKGVEWPFGPQREVWEDAAATRPTAEGWLSRGPNLGRRRDPESGTWDALGANEHENLVRHVDADADTRADLAARGLPCDRGGWSGFHVAWREPTGFPAGRPPLRFDKDDLEAARRAVGFSREEFDAVAKRRSRRARTALEAAEYNWLAERVAAVLDGVRGRRSGAVGLLCEAYGTRVPHDVGRFGRFGGLIRLG